MRKLIPFIIIILFKFNLNAQILSEEKVWESTEPEQKKSTKEEGKYKNGIKVGLWKTYHSDRNDLKSIGKYKNGKKEGIWKTFHWNNIIESIGKYVNDKKDGVWKTYLIDNQIKTIEEYDNSNIVSKTYYSNEGFIYSTTEYKNNKRFVKQFRKDGSLKNYKEYKDTWTKVGIWKNYFKNGNISSLREYLNGGLVLSKQYFSNNNLSIVEKYLNNKLNDRKQFWENGNLKYDFKYNRTILVSTSSHYQNGQLQVFTEYENGKMYNVKSCFDPDGKSLEIGTFKNGNGVLYSYDMNGKLVWENKIKNGKTIKMTKIK